MAFGAGMVLLLTALQARFMVFPLHPSAYALNLTFASDFSGALCSWPGYARPPAPYGGSRMYRQALPFFLGLILGDFVTGAAWSIVGTVLHVNLFRTFAR